ncbi:hypothetical protein [Micromonospora thermarum]|uniref:Polymerase nucleotidyl transferase domain-containing protein n=1 Tax=Micromonospora thermarum TaxID=2720024 RepID=A0ABX0ZDX7_9ACTN|nr:hypothetical protein [Micromonospora thermarum]NJP34163.1 hypothetical protein [Micromonospora thermarum]
MSGPYRDLAAGSFLDEIPRLIDTLSAATDSVPAEDRVWVFYGSRVTGVTTATSDFDVLMLHRHDEVPPTRVDATYRDAPVTVYSLSRSALCRDGQDRAYGGYFALKLFSPFVCTPADYATELLTSVARFLAPLAADVAGRIDAITRTRHQILADSYLAFLDLYPDFDSYVARVLAGPVLASPLWRRQAQVVVDAYEQARMIDCASDGRYTYSGQATIGDLRHERAIAAARFWAFGAVCHGSDFRFPDLYRDKARQHATVGQRQRVYESLQRISRGRAVR